ncbi:helix-turn-helix domain-containing protein [Candidatus Uhrbacteria bacterium]|nr:helix-turn-helix domain-containing protein [Candidatus Uhrbacteria bacterium]
MTPILERELEKLGLSEKEAKVYLAALELGPHPVQDIARKAGVNRATTYVMIEALAKRGLVTSFERGKKRLFNAEAPDRLLSLIRVRERELEEQEREFSQVLPQLRAILAASGEQPRVRFFEGAEGLRAIREEILATDAKEMWVAARVKIGMNELATPEHEEYDRRLVAKGVVIHALYTGEVSPVELKDHPNWQFRKVPEARFPFNGELSTFGGKIFALTHSGKLIGAIIESVDITNTLRSVLQLAWEGARALPSSPPRATSPTATVPPRSSVPPVA